MRLRGRQLLDHEALSCLLVLLFIDEPKLNTSRLHRVLRNLCYHGPTRDWVIKSLLSILERSNEARANSADLFPITSTPSTKGKRSAAKLSAAAASSLTPSADNKVYDFFFIVIALVVVVIAVLVVVVVVIAVLVVVLVVKNCNNSCCGSNSSTNNFYSSSNSTNKWFSSSIR